MAASEAGALICGLCPHRCHIPVGGRGFCGTRENVGGKIVLPYSGYVTAIARDPIEKKPLYHFRPGSQIISLGFAGCNLRCPFCQNWVISQLDSQTARAADLDDALPQQADRKRPHGEYLRPQDVIALAERDGAGPATHAAHAAPEPNAAEGPDTGPEPDAAEGPDA
ncbi:MAG: hypothetical protein LBT39_03925, partial [Treponema sp.]|nr:hypothetical protein [Treponema sp.]